MIKVSPAMRQVGLEIVRHVSHSVTTDLSTGQPGQSKVTEDKATVGVLYLC